MNGRSDEQDVRDDLIRQLRAWAGSKQNQHGRGGIIDQAADELAYTGRDLESATSTIDRIDAALRGDGRSAMLIVIAQEIINQYREGQERHE